MSLLSGLPLNPLLGPLAPTVNKHANDAAVKDKRLHLTAILGQGGWPAELIPTAAAVSMAESGGRTAVVNPAPCSDDGDHAVGIMQVCTVNAGAGGGPKDKSQFQEWLKNPVNNTTAGYAIYKSQGWGAWTTYTSGAYKSHMGQDPLITVDKNTLTGTVSEVVDTTVGTVAKLVAALFDPSTYFRLGKGVLGGIMLILGTAALVFVVANKASGGKVAKGAKGAAAAAVVL